MRWISLLHGFKIYLWQTFVLKNKNQHFRIVNGFKHKISLWDDLVMILAIIYILEQDYPCFSKWELQYVHYKLSPQRSKNECSTRCPCCAQVSPSQNHLLWKAACGFKNVSSLPHYHHHKEPSLSICLADTRAQCPAEMQMKPPPTPHSPACRECAWNSASHHCDGIGRVFAHVRHAPPLANSTHSPGSWDLGCSPCLRNKAGPRLSPGIQCLTWA